MKSDRIKSQNQLVLCSAASRDVREFKTRVDSYSREMLRKEAQIRDLQTRLDQGEGSEYCSTHTKLERPKCWAA